MLFMSWTFRKSVKCREMSPVAVVFGMVRDKGSHSAGIFYDKFQYYNEIFVQYTEPSGKLQVYPHLSTYSDGGVKSDEVMTRP